MGASIDACCEIEDGHPHRKYHNHYSSYQDRKEPWCDRRFHELERHNDRQAANCVRLLHACPQNMCDIRIWQRDPSDFKDPTKLRGTVAPHTVVDLGGDGEISHKEIVGAVYMSYPKLLAETKEFVPGDPVEVRDYIWESWKPGVIESINPVKVQPHGCQRGIRFKYVQPAPSGNVRHNWCDDLLRGAGEVLRLHVDDKRSRGSDLRNYRIRHAHLKQLRESPSSPFLSPRVAIWPSPRAGVKWGEEIEDDDEEEEG